MKLIRSHYNLKPEHRGGVATLGNFDGVHLGHQHVLKQLVTAGQTRGLTTTVITNEPLSREFFSPDSSPPRLTRLREKLTIFESMGVDQVLCQHFNKSLVTQAAGDYVTSVLVKGLGVKHLVIGDDTRFGKNREGNFLLLQTLGEQFQFSVEKSETLQISGQRVSSSRIRSALNEGDMSLAATLLARPYHMSGRVTHGEKRGRELGYPTANIGLSRRQSPLMGIFAVELGGLGPKRLPAVASIGVRPTFGGSGKSLLEVHIFDFNQDIYGCHVDVYFHQKLRDELYFDSVDALVEQMHKDAEQAQHFFSESFATSPTNV